MELLKPKEAAKILNVTYQTLLNYEKRGVLKPMIIGGRRYYSRDEVEKVLKSSAKPSRAAPQPPSVPKHLAQYVKLWSEIKAVIAQLSGSDVAPGSVVPPRTFDDAVLLVTKKRNFSKTAEYLILYKVLRAFDVLTEVTPDGKVRIVGYKVLK